MSGPGGLENEMDVDLNRTSTRMGEPDEASSDVEVEALVDDIEQTRSDMTETVDAIGQRLDPANVVASAKETVRDATVGKVEQMASSAGTMVEDAGATVQETGSSLVDTIRRNPLPAAMAALGIGWLWMNRTQSSHGWQSQAHRTDGGRGSYWSGGYRESGSSQGMGSRVSDAASGAADTVGSTVAGAADAVGRNVSGFADTTRSAIGEAQPQVGHMVQDVGRTAGRLIDDNPLAAGAVAVAIGTTIGLALPPTHAEERVLGEAGGRVLEGAGSAIKQPLEEMESQARQT